MSKRGSHSLLRIFAIFFFVLGVAGYSLFQTRYLIAGPSLSARLQKTLNPRSITVTGTAKRISYLYINGRQIYTDPSGHFSETLLLSPGYNIIEVEANGRFGKKISKKLEYFNQAKPAELSSNNIINNKNDQEKNQERSEKRK